ncbi:hypothetical protein H0H81_009722, partial [Sphagnurus paluster]
MSGRPITHPPNRFELLGLKSDYQVPTYLNPLPIYLRPTTSQLLHCNTMSTIETLRSSIETFKNASLGSQPKDLYEAQQWEMAGAHGMLMNGLLSVYEVDISGIKTFRNLMPWQKSTSIPEDKTQVFIEYALQWVAALEHHHEWEENSYYPLFNPKFNTESIVAEHETFHAGVEGLLQEISYLDPEKVRASGLTEAELKHIAEESEKHMKSM